MIAYDDATAAEAPGASIDRGQLEPSSASSRRHQHTRIRASLSPLQAASPRSPCLPAAAACARAVAAKARLTPPRHSWKLRIPRPDRDADHRAVVAVRHRRARPRPHSHRRASAWVDVAHPAQRWTRPRRRHQAPLDDAPLPRRPGWRCAAARRGACGGHGIRGDHRTLATERGQAGRSRGRVPPHSGQSRRCMQARRRQRGRGKVAGIGTIALAEQQVPMASITKLVHPCLALLEKMPLRLGEQGRTFTFTRPTATTTGTTCARTSPHFDVPNADPHAVSVAGGDPAAASANTMPIAWPERPGAPTRTTPPPRTSG